MAKFKDLYKQELHSLRKLSKEFAQAHPDVAPMLRENSTDPDVERLLEGFSFISAQIQEIIDDQIPEFSGGLINKFFPHYLRPLPSATIMSFTSEVELSEPYLVKKKSSFSSIPVNGTKCYFQLCADCLINPILIKKTRLVKVTGSQSYIELDIKLVGVNLSDWWADSITFHLGGLYSEAAQLYYNLLRFVDKVEILTEGSDGHVLTGDCITAEGFSDEEALLPYPGHANTSYRILQEYFLMQEKYLYIKLNSLGSWKNKSLNDSFKIRFYLDNKLKDLPVLTQKSFMLHTGPAINIFEYDAKPIVLDHMQYQYKILPDTLELEHYPIFTVVSVNGYRQGFAQTIEYVNVNNTSRVGFHQSRYDIINKSSVRMDGLDSYISIIYKEGVSVNKGETLSIKLECTNGHLPEYLSASEICTPTATSPSLLKFENLYVPTTYKVPPDDNEWMWRLQSMLSLNYLSIATAENLKSLLQFYLFLNKGEHVTRTNFQRQIDSIKEINVSVVNRMVSGILMRGQSINLKCKLNDFVSDGEAFIFASVIDRFFATYSSINSFTLFELIDSSTGEKISWPMRMGEQLLV